MVDKSAILDQVVSVVRENGLSIQEAKNLFSAAVDRLERLPLARS